MAGKGAYGANIKIHLQRTICKIINHQTYFCNESDRSTGYAAMIVNMATSWLFSYINIPYCKKYLTESSSLYHSFSYACIHMGLEPSTLCMFVLGTRPVT
jgi:hypothetical protein